MPNATRGMFGALCEYLGMRFTQFIPLDFTECDETFRTHGILKFEAGAKITFPR